VVVDVNKSVFQDWTANQGNIKGRLIMVCFRIAHIGSRSKILFYLMLPYLIFYRLIIEWVLGCEIPYKTKIGCGLKLYHGQGTVINDSAIIGASCTIRHSTTIGNKKTPEGFSLAPIIGDYVDIGANTCIIGPIKIGQSTVIGAGTILTKSIPGNAVVVGNPARIIKIQNENTYNP
jgi:putative colanic acid biosynthesis acetyltransferase WcaB